MNRPLPSIACTCALNHGSINEYHNVLDQDISKCKHVAMHNVDNSLDLITVNSVPITLWDIMSCRKLLKFWTIVNLQA